MFTRLPSSLTLRHASTFTSLHTSLLLHFHFGTPCYNRLLSNALQVGVHASVHANITEMSDSTVSRRPKANPIRRNSVLGSLPYVVHPKSRALLIYYKVYFLKDMDRVEELKTIARDAGCTIVYEDE
jgi:hypothetical protein